MRRRSRPTLAAVGTVALLALSGCDADDHPNEQRGASPVELTAKVDNEKVVVSPSEEGEGLFTVTIANLSSGDATLTFSGPTDRSTPPIGAGNVLTFKVNLEQGHYLVSVEDESVKPAKLEIGPARESAQNEILLP